MNDSQDHQASDMTDNEAFLLSLLLYVSARLIHASSKTDDFSIPVATAAVTVDTALSHAARHFGLPTEDLMAKLLLAVQVTDLASDMLETLPEDGSEGLLSLLRAVTNRPNAEDEDSGPEDSRPNAFQDYIDGLDLDL